MWQIEDVQLSLSWTCNDRGETRRLGVDGVIGQGKVRVDVTYLSGSHMFAFLVAASKENLILS